MTIMQRQADAENWADAYSDWKAADEQAHHYDNLRIQAQVRLTAARERLEKNACIGGNVLTRLYMLPGEIAVNHTRELVKVTYNSGTVAIELLRTEPSE